MNNLIIPPSANWYEASILTCAPDKTLIYGSRSDIVIIYDSPDDQPSDVKIIPRAHSQKIISTNINRNWGQPHKLLVTVAEDNIIKLWDVETRKKKHGHNAHVGHGKVIGATFAGDTRVISVSEEGIIIIWNVTLNETNVLKDIFGFKVTVTCISTCPHANWLTAFGLKNGLVIITDLRKQGKVLYKLRGHDKSVLSLSWCPAPINIFPKDPHNYVGVKNSLTDDEKCLQVKSTVSDESATEKSEVKPEQRDSDLTETNSSPTTSNSARKKKGKSVAKYNIWSNLKHADDDEVVSTNEPENSNRSVKDVSGEDFLQECQNLKNIITGNTKSETAPAKYEDEDDRVIIKAKRNRQKATQLQQENLEDKEESLLDANNAVLTKECGEIEKNLTISETTKKSVGVICTKVQIETETFNSGEEIRTDEANPNLETVLDESLNKTSGEGEESLAAGSVVETETAEDNAQNEITSEQGDSKITCGEAKREIPVTLPVKEEPRREFLLASSGKEGNIYIWRAGTDGRMQTFLSMPNKTGRRKSSKFHSDKLWIVLCWVSPTVLLSSSKSAELVKWILPKPKDTSKHFSTVHNDHNSMLFGIAAPIFLMNEYNWLDERKLNVWTFGHDRLLLNTSLASDRKNLACYPTLGNAECFALSPVDPNRLAIGTAEGIIKVWDLSRPNIKSVAMLNFFQKIQSKVVALAWHPTNELILAYGTLEGRIGFMDTSNKSKTPTIVLNFFKSQIHRVEYGPLNGNKDDLGLFAVAEGKLVYSINKSERVPRELDTPDNTFVYSFAWKPDFTMLLVSTVSGAVIVYSPKLQMLSTHYFQHRLKDIYWHPDAVLSDTTLSKHCYRLAAISNSKDVVVCDFRSGSESEERIVVKYERSEDVVNCVAWSPYASDELVISSDDGTAQVWNVESDTILSTYSSPHFEGVMSAIWSPIDSGHIISAAKDHTIRVWSIEDHPKRDEKELKELRKKVLKEITNEQVDLLPKVEKTQEEPPRNKKVTKTNLFPNFFYPKEAPQIIGDLRRVFLWKEGSQDVEMGGGDTSSNILKIFGSKNDMLNIMEQNEIVHRERGKYGLGNTLALFRGDISDKIKRAIDERRVTPWIIMMAPMVSPKLWQSSCEVYAEQLSEVSDSDPIEIASLYLACHKVEQAIDVLCESSMYREALVLAKCRLPEDTPVVTSIMEKWAKFSVTVGNFEAAAQCYIYLGKYEDAASVLFRRSDLESLRFAVELAEKSGNEDLHKAVLFRYNTFKNEKETKEEENELPSKLDAVLKQHLEEQIVLEQSESLNEKKEIILETGQDDKADLKGPESVDENKEIPDEREATLEACCEGKVNLEESESLDKNKETHDERVSVSIHENVEIEKESESRDKNYEARTKGKVNLEDPDSLDKNKEIISRKDEEEIAATPENLKIEEKLNVRQDEKTNLEESGSLDKNKEIA